ncbi:PrgI family protein [Shouchella clausii]|uniref:PrgI family protein n=1 Tax=Shouchella clausii TaxID=79880 RepID=UPI0026F43957|nr:PrgI family protein [Shouchella clausii]MDO7285905.1 PrgI family protein [Shouchella clausii]MDO7305808.1 PrgI family protein [Shouchella clausii]
MNNNYVLPIPKDLKKIQSKLFFGLTKRQLIGFGCAIFVGILTFIAVKPFSLDVAMYAMFFTVAPIFFATIYQKDGMYAEQWIKLLLEQKYLNPSKRYYKVSKNNLALAKERDVLKRAKRKTKTGTPQPVPSPSIANKQKKKTNNIDPRNT